MKATKQESIIMEGRTFRKSVTNLFKQRHQLSREFRHIPSFIIRAVIVAIGMSVSTPKVEAPIICPVCKTVPTCILPATGVMP